MPDDHRVAWGGGHRLLRSLEKQLDSLTLAGTWRVLVLSVLCIASADYAFHPAGVRLGPLYMLPVCLACWRLGFKTGLGVVVAGTMLSVGVCLAISGEMTGAKIGNLGLHALLLGAVAAIVTRFRHSFDRESERARHDYTTGALSRSAFDQQAGAIVRAGRTGFILAMIDLDGFKDVNDRHGHCAGDTLLRIFSEGVAAELRAGDCFGRLGGDEFAMLVPIASPAAARELGRSLHRRFSEILAGTGHAVTCSMGALIVPTGDERSLAELMQVADRLMYVAKRSGKNAIQIATCAPPLDPFATWLPLALGDGAVGLVSQKTPKAV